VVADDAGAGWRSLVAGRGVAQGSLAEAPNGASGWLAHDVQAVVGQSPSVVLQIPGRTPRPVDKHSHRAVAPPPACGSRAGVAGQRGPRGGAGTRYAELERRYVVAAPATSVARRSFWGSKTGCEWVLVELRSARNPALREVTGPSIVQDSIGIFSRSVPFEGSDQRQTDLRAL